MSTSNALREERGPNLSNEATEPAGQVMQEVAPPGRTPTRLMEWILALVLLCSWLASRGILHDRR